MAGKFIVLEGGEGVGKSTQLPLLARALRAAGHTVVETREPGGTKLGEVVRPIVKTHMYEHLTARQEVILFSASRISFMHEVVLPSINQGAFVLSDRFADSTFAYQAAGAGHDFVRTLVQAATAGVGADLTILLDQDPAIGLQRRAVDSEDGSRMEERGLAYHQQVRQAYLDHAATSSAHVVLSAQRAIGEVHVEIVQTVNARFGLALTVQC